MAVELAATAGTPDPPDDLPERQQAHWRAYFASPVAAALDTVDLPAVERYFRLLAVLDRIDPGENRADALHYATVAKLVEHLEATLGIGPAARARLGIKLLEARQATAASIRAGLDS